MAKNPETDLVNQICYGLAMYEAQSSIKIHHHYVGGVPNFAAHCFQKTGVFHPLGWSDITVLAKGGKIIFLEVKCPGKKQEDSQIEFQRIVESLGFTYAIAHDVNEARDVLRRVGIIGNEFKVEVK
jgi:hypothetical protein